jgi:pimeloyl-ACP methyl ester carboxylesterase
MPKIKVNDIDIYYEIHGEGDPLILIHGSPANIDWWTPTFIKEISKKYKIIIFDNRGAGRSDDPNVEYSIKTLANDTVDLIDALNIDNTYILGHSMGGMIAQELALNYSERIEKLVLCSTNCGGPEQIPPTNEAMKIMGGITGGKTPKEVAKLTIPLCFSEDFIKNNPDFIEFIIQQIIKAPTNSNSFIRQHKAIMTFHAGRNLKKINISTLIMHGEKDIMVPPQNAEIISNLIPNAKLILLNNSAHLLYLEETELFIKNLLDFLK